MTVDIASNAKAGKPADVNGGACWDYLGLGSRGRGGLRSARSAWSMYSVPGYITKSCLNETKIKRQKVMRPFT